MKVSEAIIIFICVVGLSVVAGVEVTAKPPPPTCESYGLVTASTTVNVQDIKKNGITQAKFIRSECK